jgi:hypothetical protein
MDARGGEDMCTDQIGERHQYCSAGPNIVGECGQGQIHALARIGFTLAIERLMEREFGTKDHGQKARSGPASGDHMEGRRCLADLLAHPTGKLLAHVLNHFPLTRNDLDRLGDVFAELRKPGRAAAGAGSWARHDDPLARQMIGEWFAHRLAARVGRNERGRGASLGGGHLGRDLVFGGRGFELLELKFHLIKELATAFGAAAIKLPPHLLDRELEMCDQCFGA